MKDPKRSPAVLSVPRARSGGWTGTVVHTKCQTTNDTNVKRQKTATTTSKNTSISTESLYTGFNGTSSWSEKLIAKIISRKVDEGGNLQLLKREIDIVSALDMLEELEKRTTAPLRETLRWICEMEFPAPAELAVSFQMGNYLIIAEHITDSEDINNVMVMVERVDRPEAIEIHFPSEVVKEL